MSSNLSSLKDRWDSLVVGGGITGAGIFRDLSLHGIDTLLVDAHDFTSQTSQSSSKMLHGGLRYLENLDFALVREALREKTLLLRLFSHLAREQAFVFPVYEDSKRVFPLLRAGLFLYDFLSGFQNSPHRMLAKEEVIKLCPQIRRKGLKGAGIYYDAVMDDAKIALEVLYDALERKRGNRALNHTSLKDVRPLAEGHECRLVDVVTGEEKRLSCRHLVFAVGPFTDTLLGGLPFVRWRPRLIPSQGSHLYLSGDALRLEHAVTLTVRGSLDNDRERIMFVVPGKRKTLVGTTEVAPEGDFFNASPKEEEIGYLIEQMRTYFPEANIGSDDIIASFAGIRPLVRQEGVGKAGKTARNHRIYQPRSDLFVIIGGKYTTFRVMAGDLVRLLLKKSGRHYRSRLSLEPLLKRSTVISLDREPLTEAQIKSIVETEFPRTLDDLMVRRIGIRNYAEAPAGLRETVRSSSAAASLYASEEMKKRWF